MPDARAPRLFCRAGLRLFTTLLAAGALVVACDKSTTSPEAKFYCFKVPQRGNAERECGVEPLTLCRSPNDPGSFPGSTPENCFTQDHAFCFYTEHVLGGKQYVCLVTGEECASWRKDEVAAAQRNGTPLGPCMRMQPTDQSLRAAQQE
ncbi:MAG TPA: hypothetical protein PKA88_29705 [Polyangiaceae bacterium]|nr:hypothetical protein [Polyangiaceae bacterium]HMR77158.1 hypothetical protein [Polyangiaceae bacterium]